MSANPGRNAGKSVYESVAFEFRVEEWTAGGASLVKCLAGSDDWDAARAAFDVVARMNPTRYITLRHGARVIDKNEPANGT
jgi:hypothetical protein